MPDGLQKIDLEMQQLRESISQLHQACQASAHFKARSRELTEECRRIYEAALGNARQLDSIKYSLSQLEERIRNRSLWQGAPEGARGAGDASAVMRPTASRR